MVLKLDRTSSRLSRYNLSRSLKSEADMWSGTRSVSVRPLGRVVSLQRWLRGTVTVQRLKFG